MAAVPESIRARLDHQLDALTLVLRDSVGRLHERSASGKWSAHEHLAHMARVQAVLLERLDAILSEERPPLARYRAENDGEWPQWAALPTEVALARLRADRDALRRKVDGLSEAALARVGIHPAFGPLSIPEWLDFFLLHEAHHLYQVLIRVAEARARAENRQ
jgi:uncharacterized damage-inducible protein DinB